MLCDQLNLSPNVSFMSWQYWCKFIWILVGICSAYQFGTCFAPSHCTYNRGMLIRNFSGFRCICMLRWLQRWGCSNDYFREAWIMPVLFPVKHVMSNLFRKLLFNYFSWNVKRDLKTNFPWNVIIKSVLGETILSKLNIEKKETLTNHWFFINCTYWNA